MLPNCENEEKNIKKNHHHSTMKRRGSNQPSGVVTKSFKFTLKQTINDLKKYIPKCKMSQQYLLIVESPSKCEKMKGFLRSTEKYKNTNVVATCGHFREVKSVCPDTYHVDFAILPKSKKYISSIKKLASTKNTQVILATDWDREGEAIAHHLCEILNLPASKTKRIRFGEITKKVILNAMENPYPIDKNLVFAQMSRQIIDRWIGFHFSPLLWKQFPKHRGLSAGRCQTPTLRIIYDQEQKVKALSPETNFEVRGIFRGESFLLNHRFESEKIVTSFLQEEIPFRHKVVKRSTRTVFDYPSLPFSTSALQKYCNHCYGWSPSMTMLKAQQLYEQGLITYHRTESQQISNDFKLEMAEYLRENYGEKYCNVEKLDRTEQPKNLPHEAIRVTSVDKDVENDLLYEAIRKRTFQSVMHRAEWKEHTVSISSSQPEMTFEKKYKELLFDGFLRFGSSNLEREAPKKWTTKGEVDLDNLEAKELLLDTKKFYSEGSVISNLEQRGIGRPSTFASFVAKVQDKKYVQKLSKTIPTGYYLQRISLDKKKGVLLKTKEEFVREEKSKLFMTDLGSEVVQYLYQHFSKFFEFEYTSLLESKLDEIAKGRLHYKELLQEVQKELKSTK